MTTITKEPPMERYSIRGAGGLWATIAIRGWERQGAGEMLQGGEILINSDYGNFASQWGNLGMPMKQFLATVGRDYLLRNLAGLSLYEFDFDASVARVKREVIRDRKDGALDHDEARNAWNAIPAENRGKDLFIHELLTCDAFGDEPWHFCEDRERPALVHFYADVWLPFAEHLASELLTEAEHA